MLNYNINNWIRVWMINVKTSALGLSLKQDTTGILQINLVVVPKHLGINDNFSLNTPEISNDFWLLQSKLFFSFDEDILAHVTTRSVL